MARKRTTRPAREDSERRPIWKGHISFGLVHVPVVLLPAESRNDVQFRLLDSRNHARIRYERVNEVTGEEVPWNEVVKAFEYDDENYVVLSETDFQRAAVKAARTVELEQFVDAAEISPMYFDKPYYLVPDKHGEKGYVLLREALRRTGLAGIARVVIRTREYLSLLYVEGDALTLMLLRFHQELRQAPPVVPSANLKRLGVSTREVEMAESLIQSMTGKWKPQQYHDQYRDALMKWIEKKKKTGGVTPPAPDEEGEEEAGPMINITDLLQQSLRQRGRTGARTKARTRRPKTTRRKKAG